jgi:hypothetical protein
MSFRAHVNSDDLSALGQGPTWNTRARSKGSASPVPSTADGFDAAQKKVPSRANDGCEQAQQITVGRGCLQGLMKFGGDVDTFKM